jgi:hypothetical protein
MLYHTLFVLLTLIISTPTIMKSTAPYALLSQFLSFFDIPQPLDGLLVPIWSLLLLYLSAHHSANVVPSSWNAQSLTLS